MSVKCTGAEFKAFWRDEDPAFFPEGVYIEDEEVIVNGQSIDLGERGYEDVIADDDSVSLSNGIVFGVKGEPSVETYFRRWRKARSVVTLVVECPKDRLDAVRLAVAAAGAKVVGA